MNHQPAGCETHPRGLAQALARGPRYAVGVRGNRRARHRHTRSCCALALVAAFASSCGPEYGCPLCKQFIGVDDDRCAQCRDFGKRGCGLGVPANFPPDTKHEEAMAPCDPACCGAAKAEASAPSADAKR